MSFVCVVVSACVFFFVGTQCTHEQICVCLVCSHNV